MDHHEADGCAVGSFVAIGGANLACQSRVAAFVDGEMAAPRAHGDPRDSRANAAASRRARSRKIFACDVRQLHMDWRAEGDPDRGNVTRPPVP